MKTERVFEIKRDEDMRVAVCRGPEIATQGASLDELTVMIRDLVQCRFDEGDERLCRPIRLRFINDPVLPAQVARSCRATFPVMKSAAH